MRLIHTATGQEAEIGDAVLSFRGHVGNIDEIHKPHKSSSSGHVTVGGHYNYVSVWGLKWIEREDRV